MKFDYRMWYFDVITIQIQDGGRPLIWKWLCQHTFISVNNESIMTKLGTLNQLGTLIKMIWPKFKFKFKMADGRHIINIVFGDNLAADCPIFAKFCAKVQNDDWTPKTRILIIQDGGRFTSKLYERRCYSLLLGTEFIVSSHRDDTLVSVSFWANTCVL